MSERTQIKGLVHPKSENYVIKGVVHEWHGHLGWHGGEEIISKSFFL